MRENEVARLYDRLVSSLDNFDHKRNPMINEWLFEAIKHNTETKPDWSSQLVAVASLNDVAYLCTAEYDKRGELVVTITGRHPGSGGPQR